MDVFAPLPMWASCSREPAVSWLFILSSGVVLRRRLESGFHCVRLHLPETEAFWVTPGRKIALEMGRFPWLSLLNEGSCGPVGLWSCGPEPGGPTGSLTLAGTSEGRGRGLGILPLPWGNFSFLLYKMKDWIRCPLRLHLTPKMGDM